MTQALPSYDQYYLSYSSPKLPLKMINPLTAEEVYNRNTCFGANYDDQGRLCLVHQLVYGSVELSHLYGYDDDGNLAWAEIKSVDDEIRKLWFDVRGQVIREEEIIE